MKTQRTLLLFEESIKSKETRKNYKDQLDRFLKFTEISDYDSLASMPVDDLQRLVEDYVMHLRKTVSPNSVATLISGIKHFFIMNRVKLYWEVIQKMYPQRVKSSGGSAWTTEQIRKMLEFNTSKRNKAIIHFLASTGARVGVFNYRLEMKHLRDMDNGCKAVLLYADEPEEYYAFLTPEATNALNEYFEERLADNEKFYPDTPVFRTTYRIGVEKAKPIKRNAVISIIFRTINKANIRRNRVNRNFDIQMDHGFRKRFNTVLKLNSQVNSNLAEKIMGHSVSIPLDNTYLKPALEKLFAEFKKAILKLTIDPSERLRIKNSRLEKEIAKYETQEKEIEKIKKQYESDHMIMVGMAKILKNFGIDLTQLDGESYDVDSEELDSYIKTNFAEILKKQSKNDSKLED